MKVKNLSCFQSLCQACIQICLARSRGNRNSYSVQLLQQWQARLNIHRWHQFPIRMALVVSQQYCMHRYALCHSSITCTDMHLQLLNQSSFHCFCCESSFLLAFLIDEENKRCIESSTVWRSWWLNHARARSPRAVGARSPRAVGPRAACEGMIQPSWPTDRAWLYFLYDTSRRYTFYFN